MSAWTPEDEAALKQLQSKYWAHVEELKAKAMEALMVLPPGIRLQVAQEAVNKG